MTKQTVKLAILIAIVAHSAISAVVTTKGYATLRKTQNIDPLLKKAEQGEMLTPEQKLQVRNTILSLGRTNQKTAQNYKNMIQNSKILTSLFPDVIGKEKIVKTDGSDIDKRATVKQTEQELTKAVNTYENSDKKMQDQENFKTDVIVLQNNAIKSDESNPTNPQTTVALDGKLQELDDNLKQILLDSNIPVNDQDVKIGEQALLEKTGNIVIEKETYAKIPEVVDAEGLNQELETIIQAIKDSNALTYTRNYKYITEQRLVFYSDIFKKIVEFDKKFKTMNIARDMRDTLDLRKISTYENFVANLTRDINEELAKLKDRAKPFTYGASLQFLSNRCDYLVSFTTKLQKKAEAEMGSWKQEYEKYVTPTINALLPIKNIFIDQPMVDELFANSPDKKKELIKNISVYIYGANQDTGNFPREITTDTISNLSNVSLSGLFDRYLNYVNVVYLHNVEASDKVSELFTKDTGLIYKIADDIDKINACFKTFIRSDENIINAFNTSKNALTTKYQTIKKAVEETYK